MAEQPTPSTTSRSRIVILGGGFGGAYCAQALDKSLKKREVEVLLIDRNNYFLFYPLLIEAGSGSLEPRHAVVPIRGFLRSTKFHMGRVTAIDTANRTVEYDLADVNDHQRVHFDHLVVAFGSVSKLPPVPGLPENAYLMKSINDAITLRDRAIMLLESANMVSDPDRRRALLHFVVVGGNFTGVEVAGEFQEFLRRAAETVPNVHPDECRVSLVERGDSILSALGPDLADYALQKLKARGVQIYLNNTLTEIQPTHAPLENGGTLETQTVIWCAGIAPPPVVADTDLPTDKLGYLRCRDDMRVEGFDRVWAIGDCAINPAPNGEPYPPTAQHAVQMGKHLAANLRRALDGEAPQPCRIESQGMLAPLGAHTAVANIKGVKLSGTFAWFLWRTVYLLKMPGVGRRFRIAMDWTLNLLFARDYVQLGAHRDRSS